MQQEAQRGYRVLDAEAGGLSERGADSRAQTQPSALSRAQKKPPPPWGQRDTTLRRGEFSSYGSDIFQIKICDIWSEWET